MEGIYKITVLGIIAETVTNCLRQRELMLQHLQDFGSGVMVDFEEVFKFELSKKDSSNLLEALKREGKIYFEGVPRSHEGYWKLVKA